MSAEDFGAAYPPGVKVLENRIRASLKTQVKDELMGEIHATLNLSLDGCCDEEQVIADDEFHDAMTDLFSSAAALLFGRTTYDLLHGYWPKLAETGRGKPAELRLAGAMNAKTKHVVSHTEPGADWNARRMDGDIDSIRLLGQQTSGCVLLVASPSLARMLMKWDLIDVYNLPLSPLIAGRGPTFMAGLEGTRKPQLFSTARLGSGVLINRYRFNKQGV